MKMDDRSKAIVQIAFMGDIHFHDIYAEFADDCFKGLEGINGKPNATIRTMASQLQSSRMFNENYFALIAALDDVVARGIKFVAFPGDVSDDGQPIHLRGLSKLLDHYTTTYGIEFFATLGNHDAERPFTIDKGKLDYLGTNFRDQAILSIGKRSAMNPEGTLYSDEVSHLGTEESMAWLYDKGFYPKESYLYFETPFSSDSLKKGYSFAQAVEESRYPSRQFEICAQGSGGKYKQEGYTHSAMLGDASYLVEPVEGVWLLAIDANVHIPVERQDFEPRNGEHFNTASNAGWNAMVTHKKHIIDWIVDVAERAEQQNKTVIAMSHYPMNDFYSGASSQIEQFFTPGTQNIARVPQSETVDKLLSTGLKVHINGHLHHNTTTVAQQGSHALVNIQTPSLAAYRPAYKLLTVLEENQLEVETIPLNKVANFDSLFPYYQAELEAGATWNEEILTAKSYREMSNFHIRALVRDRYLNKSVRPEFKWLVNHFDGADLLTLTQLQSGLTLSALMDNVLHLKLSSDGQLSHWIEWQQAQQQAHQLLIAHGVKLSDFTFSGVDLVTDYLRIQNADDLAFDDIDPCRLQHYKLLSQQISDMTNVVEDSARAVFQAQFGALFGALQRLERRAPSKDFSIDMKTGTVRALCEGA